MIVLGAGCSGLYAARTLKALNNKLKVLVIEANDYVGGRVKTDETFAPLRLPLGAEFIHEYALPLLLSSLAVYNLTPPANMRGIFCENTLPTRIGNLKTVTGLITTG